jgi:hypothetical protein
MAEGKYELEEIAGMVIALLVKRSSRMHGLHAG